MNRVITLLHDGEINHDRLDNPAIRHGLIRLAGLAHALLEPHRINRHGRCPICRRVSTSRQTPCTVLPLAGLYLLEPLDVVWWQTLNHQGQTITLDEIRTWLTHTDPDDQH